MAAPKFSPVPPTLHARSYASPEHVPASWQPDRPGDIEGFQPVGTRLGDPGPDQGYALRIARQLRPRIRVQPGENVDDAIRGCLGVALRRASIFSRAPVIHDLTIAFTIWGFFDEQPPAELVELRGSMFEGLRLTNHHYAEGRAVADLAPEATLRMTPAAIDDAY
ncbi:MAG: hypothetical protein WBP59_10105, partial [Ilumatobacteraceae bacterium]